MKLKNIEGGKRRNTTASTDSPGARPAGWRQERGRKKEGGQHHNQSFRTVVVASIKKTSCLANNGGQEVESRRRSVTKPERSKKEATDLKNFNLSGTDDRIRCPGGKNEKCWPLGPCSKGDIDWSRRCIAPRKQGGRDQRVQRPADAAVPRNQATRKKVRTPATALIGVKGP